MQSTRKKQKKSIVLLGIVCCFMATILLMTSLLSTTQSQNNQNFTSFIEAALGVQKQKVTMSVMIKEGNTMAIIPIEIELSER